MTIEEMFTEEEIERIKKIITNLNQDFDRRQISRNQRHYFTDLANKFGLTQRIELELSYAGCHKITTNADIARLFGVDYSAVSLYLKVNLEQDKYKRRVEVCLVEGGSRGGNACTSSPRKYKPKPWLKREKL